MTRPRCVAVLDVMWGDRAADRGPRWFTINPENHSGRRLYKLTVGFELVVTNACPQVVTSAKGRGVPSPDWLALNVTALAKCDPSASLFLVCGSTAHATWKAAGLGEDVYGAAVLFTPHPAWRGWTKAVIDELTARITLIREGLT